MATNKVNEKELKQDQAFIQSLYDDLAEQNSEDGSQQLTDVQPSELLDKRILAAAHKAINSAPAASKNGAVKTVNSKTPKQAEWFYPATMAASVLLVVTIISHQFYNPNVQVFDAPLASTHSMSKFDESQSDEMLSESEMPLLAAVQTAEPSLKRSSAESAAKMESFKADKQIIKEKVSKQGAAKAKDSQTEKSREQLRSRALLTPIEMSFEQLKTLRAISYQNALYWILQQENADSYLIELFIVDQSPIYYRLNKNEFNIDKRVLSQQTKYNKQPLSAIRYNKDND